MSKTIIFFLLLLGPLSIIAVDFSVEGRVSYYHLTSKHLRHSFGNGWADYEVQVSTPLSCDWKIWASVNGFSREGRSSSDHLQLIPINIGLKYYFPFTYPFQLYISGAASYSFMRVKENSYYFHIDKHKSSFGGLLEGGFDYPVWEGLFVNFFVQGYFQEFDFHNPEFISVYGSPVTTIPKDIHVDLSGLKIGVGLGYQF